MSFSLGQLARALTAAGTHEDPAARQRAEQRVRRWQQVVDGMAAGTLDIGSRTPMWGLPVWVTPEVLHGGFATGTPAAGGALRPDEADRARRWGLPAARRVLFWSWLTDAGLAELGELLDSGRYRVEYAEEAALPVVAWLLRAGAAAAERADRDDARGADGVEPVRRRVVDVVVRDRRRRPGRRGDAGGLAAASRPAAGPLPAPRRSVSALPQASPPRLAAATAASAYPDPALRILMDATYRAFRSRRSVLLLNLEHQVSVAELPWVRAVASARIDSSDTREQAGRTLARLASAAVTGFPATVLPNPLVKELSTLSKQCLDEVLRLTARIHHNPRPLSTVKNTAYAWRHMLFFLSLSTGEEQAAFLAHSAQRLAAQPDHVRTRLAPAVTGLGHIVGGGTFDPNGRAGTGRRLLGWATREHWILGPSPRGA
ncbi:hypothetical protein ACGFIK_26045 [Micromonospora sp. NPDC048871]|uniref:hypothetical protein n=1 Tax=Micromonospora sp. NPDC048871 TaxID=3364259 RepID=UPI003716E2CB